MAGGILSLGFRHAPGANSGPPTGGRRLGVLVNADVLDGGPYRLAGQTVLDGVPVPRRVAVLDEATLRLVRGVRTGNDGAFAFPNLRAGPWIVLGIDDAGNQNGVVFTLVTAAP